MASKNKKQSAGAAATSTTIELVTPSTPQSSHSSQQSTPGTRPVSPARISRIQERAELQNLNDRLAAYIERNRQLESENSKLKVHVQKNVEQREIVSIKKMYETELGDTRNTLDTIAKEKAQAELLLSRAQEDLKRMETKFNKKNTEYANLEKKVNNFEAQLDDLRKQLNQGIAERKRLEGEIKNLNEENKTLDDKSESLKKQLEEETILRVDLENRNQSLNEELQFQRQLYNKELEEVRTKEFEIKEVYQENVRSQYEQKLNKELTELREENENRLAQYRQELEEKYEAQLGAVHDDLERKVSDLQNAQTKIKQLNSTYTYMTSEIDQVKKENKSLKDKVADLNKLIEQERDWNQAALNRKDEEVADLNARLQAVLDENKDLVDDKIKLDNELATYRKLLETEENRLNISPQVASSPLVSTSSVGSYTPKAFIARGQKRKRICLTEEENLSDLMVTSNAKGDVEISDHDQDGKFVKLLNKGDKEVSLSGWQLIRLADGLETRFKFHRSISIKPGQTITVWSSDSNAVHHPPSDIVMKAQTWFTAEKMSTTLRNTNNEEMASRSTEKKMSSHSQRYSSHGYFTDENETEDQQKCAIM